MEAAILHSNHIGFLITIFAMVMAWLAFIGYKRIRRQQDPNWGRYGRSVKRGVRVDYKGRNVRMLEMLEDMAKGLPVFNATKTGIRKDHMNSMRKAYMKSGISGVEDYLKQVKKTHKTGKVLTA